MFGMSITSISSIMSRNTRSNIADLAYLYYTFDVADITGTSALNRVSTFYDASLSNSGLLDGSNNISGTTDLSLNSASSQFVQINSSLEIGKSTGLSILFWVRYGTDNSNGTRIFDFGNNPASDNIEVYIDAIGIPIVSIYSGSTPYSYSFGYPMNDKVYRHVGITMAADGTFQYYINGVLYKTTTGNQYPADIPRTTNYIGKSSNNALYFNGGVGEIRIYNNVVSNGVISNNMNTNIRLYDNSYMTNSYGFKYTDLQNGKIKNLVSDVYDASFLAPLPAFNIQSFGIKQLGITTGTQKYNNLTSITQAGLVNSRINSNFLYNIPTAVVTGTAPVGKSIDSNYGIQILNGFTAPSTGGFSVNFWFYTLALANVYDIVYFSLNNGNTTVPNTITQRIAFGVNSTVSGVASTSLWLNTVKDASNNKNSLTVTGTPGSFVNNGWHQFSLVVDYNAQTMKSYIDLDTYVFTHQYLDFSNTTFNYCTLMNDITFGGYDYNRPVAGCMDNFRIYNVPLRTSELKQLAQIPITTNSRVYTLRAMTAVAPVNGNVAIYMDSGVNNIYLSEGVGNLYVGNVALNTWTKSTLAGGSSGQLDNRNWRDIVCNGTGQYVVACVRTYMNDPSGVVFYSSDYGSTFTQTASVIDTSYCFNLAMSDDGNYTYMTAWGVPTPNQGTWDAYGNLFTSLDKGITWSRITDVSGAGITVGNPSWASVPSQVRCNSTGEYLSLGPFSHIGRPITLSNYGHQLDVLPVYNSSFGLLNSNPVLTYRSTDNALLCSIASLSRNSGLSYAICVKTVYRIAEKGIAQQNCNNFPSAIGPATTSVYPWTGLRNINMSTDRKNMVMVDTAGLGNVFVTTNGIASADWPDTTNVAGIVATVDAINLSIPNAVSQTAVPRSAWSGLCINYNDQFAFANKTGTVYLYTWTLS